MHPILTKPRQYYISSLRLRKELIPQPDIAGYRCITTAADGPRQGDTVLADQVAFDDVLIELDVYPKRGMLHGAFANIWRRWHMDKLVPQTRSPEPRETLLYRLDSPQRPSGYQ